MVVVEKKRSSDVGLNRIISLGEAHALMRAATSERDRLIVLVCWSTGCRISETMTLRACDLLPEDSALRLRNRKQTDKRKEKNVVVPGTVLSELQHYIDANGMKATDWLFPGRRLGRPLTERQARNVIYRLAESAEVKLPDPRCGNEVRRIWPHVLRHSYITHLLRNGVDILTVAEQAGHANIANTRKYSHLVIGDVRKAVANVQM